jgi:hypothetical protein
MVGSFLCVLDMRDGGPASEMVAGWSTIPRPIGPLSCLVHAAGRFGEYRAPRAVAALKDQRDATVAAVDFPLAGF